MSCVATRRLITCHHRRPPSRRRVSLHEPVGSVWGSVHLISVRWDCWGLTLTLKELCFTYFKVRPCVLRCNQRPWAGGAGGASTPMDGRWVYTCHAHTSLEVWPSDIVCLFAVGALLWKTMVPLGCVFLSLAACAHTWSCCFACQASWVSFV